MVGSKDDMIGGDESERVGASWIVAPNPSRLSTAASRKAMPLPTDDLDPALMAAPEQNPINWMQEYLQRHSHVPLVVHVVAGGGGGSGADDIPTIEFAPDLRLKRLLIGLWQVADLERDGGLGLDRDAALKDLASYASAGFTTFDMADHYGSSEVLVGELMTAAGAGAAGVVPLTKWVPKPDASYATAEAVDAAVKLSLSRLQCKVLPLLQYHTWAYLDGPGRWLHQLKLLAAHEGVGHLGLTNVDTEHLRLAIADGVPIVSNQICFSLLDRRALTEMCSLCADKGVKLLAFGVLAGGLLTDRWLGKPPPTEAELSESWSLAKYYRFVPLFGGWPLLQELLQALRSVADRHGTKIAAVATQWVLSQKAVGSVIIGARLGKSSRLDEHRKPFEVKLSEADLAEIGGVLARSEPIPGDCGDEYRRPPFLTASGDLSHHLSSVPAAFVAKPMAGHTTLAPRLCVDSGSIWEPIAGFSRATRIGTTIRVSGTTATSPLDGACVGGQDAGAQTTFALDLVEAALKALGAGLEHVVRTRLLVRNVDADWEAVARAHGRRFARAGVRPSNTLVGAPLVGEEYLVEIEAEAELPPDLTALPLIQEEDGKKKKGKKEAPIPPQLGSVSVDGDSFASDPSKYHLALLEAMVSAQTVGEEAVQDVVAAELSAIGCEVERVVYTPSGIALRSEFAASSAIASGERVAIVGRWTGSSAGAGGGSPEPRSLIMFAHPDGEDPAAAPSGSGPAHWTRPPFHATMEDKVAAGDGGGRRVYGWGIADDIMGVAAGVCAMRSLHAAGLRPLGGLTMASTPSKRHARGCAELVQRGYAADAALYLHPAESGAGLGEIKAYTSGQLLFTISVKGTLPSTPSTPPASEHPHWSASVTPEGDGHCAFAFTAANPLDKLLVLREALLQLGEQRAQRVHHPTIHAAAGRSTNVLVSSMRCGFGHGGGRSLSSVQPTAELGGAITFPPSESLADVKAEVAACVAAAASRDAYLSDHPPEITWLSGVSGAEVPTSHALYQTVSASIEAATGVAPHVNPMHTSSDIRVPAVQLGVPCVGFGSRSGNVAQNGLADEWIDLDDFGRMVRAVEGAVKEWCGVCEVEV